MLHYWRGRVTCIAGGPRRAAPWFVWPERMLPRLIWHDMVLPVGLKWIWWWGQGLVMRRHGAAEVLDRAKVGRGGINSGRRWPRALSNASDWPDGCHWRHWHPLACAGVLQPGHIRRAGTTEDSLRVRVAGRGSCQRLRVRVAGRGCCHRCHFCRRMTGQTGRNSRAVV